MSLRNIALVFCAKPRNLFNYNKHNDKQNQLLLFLRALVLLRHLYCELFFATGATKKSFREIQRNESQ